jgi:hypothetical protein
MTRLASRRAADRPRERRRRLQNDGAALALNKTGAQDAFVNPTNSSSTQRPPDRRQMNEIAATNAVGTSILFENERIRMWEMVLAPGETCATHRHLHDHMLLYAEPATIQAKVEGRPVIQPVEDGLVSYTAVGPSGLPPHAITNIAKTPSRHFIVELLGPSTANAPGPRQHNGRARTGALA